MHFEKTHICRIPPTATNNYSGRILEKNQKLEEEHDKNRYDAHLAEVDGNIQKIAEGNIVSEGNKRNKLANAKQQHQFAISAGDQHNRAENDAWHGDFDFTQYNG